MNDQFRTLPHNIEAERAIIGGLMLDNNMIDHILPVLDSDGRDFYHTGNRLLFRAILKVIDGGAVADTLTVCDFLRGQGELEKIGGHAFVAEVMEAAVSAANVTHLAKIVKKAAMRRTLYAEASRLIDVACDPTTDVDEALNEAQKSILGLSLTREGRTLHTSKELAQRTFAMIEKRHEQGGTTPGLKTGLRDFDKLTLGLHAGELIIIAARPGVGKTALAGNIALNVAQGGTTSRIVSLEMSGQTLMERFFASISGIDSRVLRRGLLHGGQWQALIDATARMAEMPLSIDDNSDMTPGGIRAEARRMKAEHGLGLLIVDYIQLMTVPGKRDTREREVAEISRTLKALARELEIPVIGLSQLNRAVESRPNRRPMLSDLRESGAIEQDADVIAFIYRDDACNEAEVIVAKHRNGPTGTIKLRFNAATQTFSDI